MLLRHDSHCPKLPEMVIKSDSALNPKPFPHDPADAVRDTPALIVLALQAGPCLLDISRPPPDNLGNLLRKQTGSQTEGTSKLAPDVHQRQEFVYHVISGNQQCRVSL